MCIRNSVYTFVFNVDVPAARERIEPAKAAPTRRCATYACKKAGSAKPCKMPAATESMQGRSLQRWFFAPNAENRACEGCSLPTCPGHVYFQHGAAHASAAALSMAARSSTSTSPPSSYVSLSAVLPAVHRLTTSASRARSPSSSTVLCRAASRTCWRSSSSAARCCASVVRCAASWISARSSWAAASAEAACW